jgi:hypothetical protein
VGELAGAAIELSDLEMALCGELGLIGRLLDGTSETFYRS